MLKRKELYSEFERYIINNEVTSATGAQSSLDAKESDGVLFPIEFQIRKFFEIPKVFEEAMDHIQELKKYH